MALTPGPYLEVPIKPGETAPFYALRFDKHGRSEGPLTQQHAIDALAAGGFTDVYLFSHGWNNDWATALDRYKAFMMNYRNLRDEHDLSFDRPYRPLLVGVFWPSTALVMPWEQGPEFAGADGQDRADAVDLELITEMATNIADEDLATFYSLVERDTLTEPEAKQLLRLLSGVFADGDPDVEGDPGRDVDDMLVSWAKLEATLSPQALAASPGDFGAVGAGGLTEPAAAGFLDKLNPRNLIRGLTVWQMKDRAGVVGSRGVGPLLRLMQDATQGSDTRFHLVGHSYGARVVLTAVAHPHGGPLPRPVDSMLLLQPAVNHLCFADRLPNGGLGGFRQVLAQVRQPILSTFSSNDFPLSKTFHLALRRGKDLGEVQIAADTPPSPYAALGGYGPRGFDDWEEVPIKDPTVEYDLGPHAPEVWAVMSDRTISSHGDVVNNSTAWALFCLAKG